MTRKTLFVFLACSLVGSIALFMKSKHIINSAKSIEQNNIYKIAFITKTAPYHDAAARGFKDAARSDDTTTYEIRTYITEGQQKTLSTSILEEAVATNPDLICVAGATLSQVARSVTAKRQNPIPVLFIGATDPVGLGLVDSLDKPATNMTGINIVDGDEDKSVFVMKALKPEARHVLLPYCPLASGGDVERQAFYAKSFLENRGTRVTLIPIYKLPEIIPKVKGLIQSADTVMYLPGCLVDEAAEGLIKLCNQYHVSLFANQPLTVKQGAAFGYGTDSYIIGKEAYTIAKRIVVDKEKPQNIPVRFISNGRRVAINLDAAKQQNLEVPEELLFFISRGIIYQDGKEV